MPAIAALVFSAEVFFSFLFLLLPRFYMAVGVASATVMDDTGQKDLRSVW
jgi:hypothetical protein